MAKAGFCKVDAGAVTSLPSFVSRFEPRNDSFFADKRSSIIAVYDDYDPGQNVQMSDRPT